ncbi:MAG: cell division protein ZapA [Pseudomonadota bacterium]
MAEVKVSIGGREFEVACRDGEEHFLLSAAELLNNEASALNEALGRMPENRMLLMAGLMLADKTASLEDKLKAGQPVDTGQNEAQKRVKKLERQLGRAQAALADANAQLSESEAKLEEQTSALTAERDGAVAMLEKLVEKAEAAAKG